MSNAGKRGTAKAKGPQLYLGYETALLYWRAVHEGRLAQPVPIKQRNVPANSVTGYGELREIDLAPLDLTITDSGAVARYVEQRIDWGSRKDQEPEWRFVPAGLAFAPGVPTPLHVLTSDMRQRAKHPSIVTHLLTGDLPKGSFYRVSASIVVASPELAFLQSCHPQYDLPNIELALEFCGTYALHPGELPCRFDVSPVTSCEKLAAYVKSSSGRHGVQAARRALLWACDGIASPREEELYLLLRLPARKGGYGLPEPLVNDSIDDDELEGLPESMKRHYVPDLQWKTDGRKIILEYDGYEEHERDPLKVAADKERRSIIAAQGSAVIVMTKRDLVDVDALRNKVVQLCYALGIKLQEPKPAAHAALFEWLTNSQRDHLPYGYGYH